MNKKLLSLAVGAALASAPLFAQADTVLYGKVHVSIDAPDADVTGAQDDTNIQTNSSRLGIKGSEDLGNGLAAIYQYETRVDVTDSPNGATPFDGSRNSFIGLKGGFGTVLFGRHDTPMKDVSRAYDLFGDQIGDSRNILTGGFDPRWNNSVRYMTPKMGAFSAEAQYSVDTGGTTNNDNNDDDGFSVNGRFDGGMFDIMVGYEQNNRSGAIPAGQTDDTSAFRVGGGVNFDPFRIVALWQSNSDEGYAAGADRDMYGIGASMAMGNNRIKLQYYVADDVDGTASSGAEQISIGLDHKFSKRTTAYVAYATMDNDTNAGFVPWGGGHQLDVASANGADPSVFSVGMIHSF